MQDKISIIIPVYNVKEYVSEAIESVINQTYKNLEIIIIDDGSNDGSENICDEYKKKDKRIKLVHQKNKGLSAARNKGLDIMKGKYVAFLDSDDAYHPEMIEKLYNTIIKNQADCALCNYTVQKSNRNLSINNIDRYNKKINIETGLYYTKNALKNLISEKINIAVWNKLYKSNLFDNIKFPEGHVHEDRITNMLVFEKIKKVYVINELLMIHHINNNSISHTYTNQNIKDLNLACISCEKRVKENLEKFYDIEDYYRMCNKSIRNYITNYLKNESSKNPEKKEVRGLLKGYINESKKNVNLKYFSKKQRIIYEMYNRCRWLLVFIYKIYDLKNKLI